MEYFKITKLNSYNFIFAGILLLLYEATVLIFNLNQEHEIRNAVDLLLVNVIQQLPFGSLLISGMMCLWGGYYIYKDKQSLGHFKLGYLVGMYFESIVWAAIVYFNLVIALNALIPGMQMDAETTETVVKEENGLLMNLSLSLGAGFYEELFFRVFLVFGGYGLLYLIGNGWKGTGNAVISAIITSVLFSIAHFDFVPGVMGEPFTMSAFIFRTAFGLVMFMLLYFRGFGITAWTHALYDTYIYIGRGIFQSE
jgi:hypothetical protein